MKLENDPKHNPLQNRMATKEKSHSGANLSIPEMMWWELKTAVNKSMPENRNELKQRFKEE